MQAILEERKLVLKNDEVAHLSFPMATYEFAIQNVWDQVKNHEKLIQYLPDDEIELERYPDRKFFWGVALTIIPQWSRAYINEVLHQRHEEKLKAGPVKMIQIS